MDAVQEGIGEIERMRNVKWATEIKGKRACTILKRCLLLGSIRAPRGWDLEMGITQSRGLYTRGMRWIMMGISAIRMFGLMMRKKDGFTGSMIISAGNILLVVRD